MRMSDIVVFLDLSDDCQIKLRGTNLPPKLQKAVTIAELRENLNDHIAGRLQP